MTLLLCAAPTLVTPMVLEDFQDGAEGWRFFTDQVMGGVSEGQAVMGRDGGIAFATLTGDVSTDNNGGFVQMQRDLPEGLSPDSTGLSLTVRGNGELYYIHVRTTNTRRPWQYFATTFPTNDNWTEIMLKWSDFAPSGRGYGECFEPDDIRSIGIVAFGRDHVANVSVSGIIVN